MKRALFLILLLNVYYLSFARIVDEELHEDEIYSLLEGYARNIIHFNREHPQ